MGIRQRKDKKGGASRQGSPAEDYKGLQQHTTAADESPASEDWAASKGSPENKTSNGTNKKSRSAFARAASLDVSEDEDSLIW